MSGTSKLPSARRWRAQRHLQAQHILDQLPEIPEPDFILAWDLELSGPEGDQQRYWIILHDNSVIYREPARLEDYHRFELLARLLREKYGNRIRDLIPAQSGEVAYYLYGDFLGGVARVEAARKRNFAR
jgi:hypothetical protein